MFVLSVPKVLSSVDTPRAIHPMVMKVSRARGIGATLLTVSWRSFQQRGAASSVARAVYNLAG